MQARLNRYHQPLIDHYITIGYNSAMSEADKQAVIDYITGVTFGPEDITKWNQSIWPAVEAARYEVVTGLVADSTLTQDQLSDGWLEVAVLPIHNNNASDGLAMYPGRRTEIGTMPTSAFIPIGIMRQLCLDMIGSMQDSDIVIPQEQPLETYAQELLFGLSIPIITYVHTEPVLGDLPQGTKDAIQVAISLDAQSRINGIKGINGINGITG